MRLPQDYIIFPLDVPSYDAAMSFVETLHGHVGLFKVGLELFIAQGPDILEGIQDRTDAGIFLDLKLHDIPATVKRAFMAASMHKPRFVTVHCDEGDGFLRAVAEENPGNTKILAITVLTSLNQEKLLNLGHAPEYAEDVTRLVLLKARIAQAAGCQGVVCSGLEVALVRKELGPDMVIVTPGIRPAWTVVDQDDQKRIVTPADAVRNGSDYVVIGRPIRDAKNPADAARRVGEEIAEAL
ncbi:MAG TPA: orotidine-5'-phosphate decarboxylase [Desulfobacteraceae bacterium]|nr:orotidine-5'-phosphate decarboxylase [Desulfobacteraceae bacterium]